ncbi:MAG: thiolase family protein [Clostridia bacterium]|nr:thiolase family protein [Clostridia bacterium]
MERKKVFVVGSGRSAIGKYQGSLAGCDPVEVCRQVISASFPQQYLNAVDEVILGAVLSAGMGQGPARQIALAAGIPQKVPAYLVGMVCGSGMQALRSAADSIRCGASAVLCGGFEFMSNAPYLIDGKMRRGTRMGDQTMKDMMMCDGLVDAMSGVHMGVTAENIAALLGITRGEQDAYAYETNQRAIRAVDEGCFAPEIRPVEVRQGKQTILFDADEFPNRTSTPEKLAKLRPAFKQDGTVTAGNSSGLNDGCAFLLLADEDWCRMHDVTPVFEIVETTACGCDPSLMGLGPVDAVKMLLDRQSLSLGQIETIELNEAFAAQALGCIRLLCKTYGISEAEMLGKTNCWGSGIGLGHPLGMSGARLPVTLMTRMQAEQASLGLASLCVGGGMGLATLIRRVDQSEWLN